MAVLVIAYQCLNVTVLFRKLCLSDIIKCETRIFCDCLANLNLKNMNRFLGIFLNQHSVATEKGLFRRKEYINISQISVLSFVKGWQLARDEDKKYSFSVFVWGTEFQCAYNASN